ncbi:unnamed protein product [Bursaphelenchus okinawaensis]|uniref:Snake toxin/toxin-like domain-containing protein n=1 Tax=Bursaphelenchus okinawaensis TaxID=465554 RepID=A0A811L5L6_9BILA|nr:unnamed protein product [Bursaphelenchus okinawaensis]CAG9117801.1 unnamed protein product [Bursaphelenchus okinawaensis]
MQLVISTLFILCFTGVDSLRCFHSENGIPVGKNNGTTQCATDVAYCLKKVNRYDSSYSSQNCDTDLQCSPATPTAEDEMFKYYCCNTDLCNSASLKQFSIFMIISFFTFLCCYST